LAELLEGGDPPALGIVGMDVEMNEIHTAFSPPRLRGHRGLFPLAYREIPIG
jgi:hypothetical protein